MEELKTTADGGSTALQRDVAVARLLPITENSPLTFQSRASKSFKLLKPVVELAGDPVLLLLEDRQKDRR